MSTFKNNKSFLNEIMQCCDWLSFPSVRITDRAKREPYNHRERIYCSVDRRELALACYSGEALQNNRFIKFIDNKILPV